MDDWRAISDAMALERPVFIGGMPRSGTTALRQTLQYLPAFRSRDDQSRETRVFEAPLRLTNIRGRNGERYAMYLQNDEEAIDAFASLVEPLAPSPLHRVALSIVHRAGKSDRMLAWRLSQGRHLVRVFFHVAKQARGFDRVIEKTPGTEKYMDRVLDAFPRARVLICERSPVDVYASFRKRVAIERKDGTPARGFEIDVDTFIDRYRESTAATAQAAAHGAMVIRYEELTTEPERTLRAVCAFIEESFDADALLDREELHRPEWGPNALGRIVANPSHWERFVTEDEAARIRSHLQPFLSDR